MNMHKGARLTPYCRALLVKRIQEHGLRVEEAAQAAGVSVRTAYKWLHRFRSEGQDGLENRSSRPHRCPHATPSAKIDQVKDERENRQTYHQIASQTGVALSTVGRLLKRAGLNRLAALEPAAPIQRYEHDAPGDLLHLDIKKLARFRAPGHRVTGIPSKGSRGIGWEYVHVAIDDHSRIAFSQLHPNEGKHSAIAHLKAAITYYASLGIQIRRLLTDNGPCYRSKSFARFCQEDGYQTPLHPALHTPHQWQGRTLYPDLSARVGVCAKLPILRATRSPSEPLAAFLQLASVALEPRLQATDQQVASFTEQPGGFTHLSTDPRFVAPGRLAGCRAPSLMPACAGELAERQMSLIPPDFAFGDVLHTLL